MTYDAIIIGAGPGGSSAALALARAGLKVAIFDGDSFPRNKLCGEFLSGEGVAALASFGLEDRLASAGALPIRRVVVSGPSGCRYEGPAPDGAVSLTRYRLDALLIDEVRASGADVFLGEAILGVEGGIDRQFSAMSASGTVSARSVICAAGRSSRIVDQLRGGRSKPEGDRLVAFKTYYKGDLPDSRVELHAFRGGYCGLQRVEDHRINACWVTRASTLRESGGKPAHMIEHTFSQNAHLRGRLKNMTACSDNVLAVSNLDFQPKTPVAADTLMVGDSAGMIAPMCGDGMSMAIRSGLLAGRLVEAFVGGQITGGALLDRYETEWKRTFLRRLWLGALLHRGMERTVACETGVRICRAFPAVGRWLTANTR
ncbi:MAG: FAD-dependent monooxygenase [Rhodothermia bacterium]|nr:FAD-dependent monooxygenase [Rhodothermia bacterium]